MKTKISKEKWGSIPENSEVETSDEPTTKDGYYDVFFKKNKYLIHKTDLKKKFKDKKCK